MFWLTSHWNLANRTILPFHPYFMLANTHYPHQSFYRGSDHLSTVVILLPFLSLVNSKGKGKQKNKMCMSQYKFIFTYDRKYLETMFFLTWTGKIVFPYNILQCFSNSDLLHEFFVLLCLLILDYIKFT